MTKDLANIMSVKRAIDDINKDIEKHRRYVEHFTVDNTIERVAFNEFKDKLDKLLTVRHALDRKLEEYEKS